MGGQISQLAQSGGTSGVGQALVNASPILKALQNVGQGVGVASQTPQMPTVGSAGVGTPGPVSPDGSTAMPSGSGRINPQDFTNYMVQNHGWSPQAAMGMAANIQDESGFRSDLSGDNGQSYGMAQWRNERKAALQQFAKSQGKSPSDWQVQADFLNNEMQGPYANTFKAMNSASSPNQAAAIAVNQFEMPAEKYRVAREKAYLNADFSTYLPNGQTVASTSTPAGMSMDGANPQQQGLIGEMNAKTAAAQNGQPSTGAMASSTQDKILGGLFGSSGAGMMRGRGMPQLPQTPMQPSQPAVDTGAEDVAAATQNALNRVAQSTMTPSTTKQASIQALRAAQKAQV